MNIAKEDQDKFPIVSLNGFLQLFESHIRRSVEEKSEPNLAFLSILLGYLESRLTLSDHVDLHTSNADSTYESSTPQRTYCNDPKDEDSLSNSDSITDNKGDDFPALELSIVEALFYKFSIIVKSVIDRTSTENTTRSGYATKVLCKKVSDIVWNRLHPHYHTDKAHIQSLFSFLTGKQLDCFGLASIVIAGCQIMKYSDVHLAMSEDHAWAVHGENNKNWLYLSGYGIVCTRIMEVAAMVVAINPAIDSHTDSETLYIIQHKLLKFMYKLGALDKYPLGLSLLAEFDNSEDLYMQSVQSSEKYYDGSHVLPYCFQGQFYLKNGDYKAAISCWSKAAHVLPRYNYTRDDEELYREIMDIAKEYIPLAIKKDPSICDNRNCFLDLIRFYDGICLWEEDSSTPVLHSWWAKYFTNTLGRFPFEVRETFQNAASNEKDEVNKNDTTQSVKHSLRNDGSSPDDTSKSTDEVASLLGVRSFKMKGLEGLLVGSKKFNAQTVSLQLTAQSQVHLSRKRQSSGAETTTGYSGRIKKPKKFFE